MCGGDPLCSCTSFQNKPPINGYQALKAPAMPLACRSLWKSGVRLPISAAGAFRRPAPPVRCANGAIRTNVAHAAEQLGMSLPSAGRSARSASQKGPSAPGTLEKPMALTLNISVDMELLLHKEAAIHGQDVTAYLLGLVERDINVVLSEYSGLEDFASSVVGIQAGLDDIEAGRTITLEEMVAQGAAEREQRRAAREGKRSQ